MGLFMKAGLKWLVALGMVIPNKCAYNIYKFRLWYIVDSEGHIWTNTVH